MPKQRASQNCWPPSLWPRNRIEWITYCEAATLYRRCRSQGSTIRSTIDCLIARICLRHDYDLLTKDRDFRLIA
ncbi:PIN domain-containing protein, partial [Candidatus Contendibacter odensensis]|uniref:PIN domain-containing protein n=1 Tax=Candidatus Contendibacter odensensis TaxID=1400860 RepID=UPI003B968E8E